MGALYGTAPYNLLPEINKFICTISLKYTYPIHIFITLSKTF